MRALPVILLLVSFPAHAAEEPSGFEAPAANPAFQQSLESLTAAISERSYAAAAAQLDTLLRESENELVRSDDGGIISVTTAARRFRDVPLGEEYRKLVEVRVRAEFDALRADANTAYEQLYLLARRHPLSEIAADCYVEAANRAARMGDRLAAREMFLAARRTGWTPDDAHRAVMNACDVAARAQHFAGPVAFDAPWYGQAEQVSATRVFPWALGETAYFAGPRHVMALKENGQPIWRYVSPEAWMRGGGADRSSSRSRGAAYTPAVYASSGGPELIVVRQLRNLGRDHCLRAVRASDGKVLWGTDADVRFDRINFVSAPVIAGRCVYAVAAESTDALAELKLLALDVLSGKVIFQTTLGRLNSLRRGWEDAWEQSEPAVFEDLLLLTPNVGLAFALDRHDGKIRWTRRYKRRTGGENSLLRYRCTPLVANSTVVIAPQDLSGAAGLDLTDGRMLWAIEATGTLVGGTDELAAFVSDSVTAIELGNGKKKWSYETSGSVRISGPPSVLGNLLYVPRSDGRMLVIDLRTGRPAESPPKHPNMQGLLATEAAKKALADAGLLPAFK